MLALLLSFPALLWAASTGCPSILKAAGASEEFGTHVGHAIHSLSLRTLRKFEPTVTEKNRVPTINMDLQSDEAVLPYTPERNGPSSEMFHSEGMKILDEVLSHMDSSSYDIKFFSTLERVVHAFHMEEMWMMALHQYQKLKTNPPGSQACQCAMDMENNGIMKMIRFSALAMREPMLIYGEESHNSEAGPEKKGYDIGYSIGRKKRYSNASNPAYVEDEKDFATVFPNGKTIKTYRDVQVVSKEQLQAHEGLPGKQDLVRRGYTFQIGKNRRSTETDHVIPEQDNHRAEEQGAKTAENPTNRGYYFGIGRKKRASGGEFHDQRAYPLGYQLRLNPADKLLLQKDDAMPKLVDAASWEKWKEIAKMNPQEDFDTALFLYCALH